MSDFSIRERVCGHQGASDADLEDDTHPVTKGRPGLARLYHQIDLMMHLCGDMPLPDIYGDHEALVKQMMRRMSMLPKRLHQHIHNSQLAVIAALSEMVTLTQALNTDLQAPLPANHELTGILNQGDRLPLRVFFENRFLDAADAPKGKTGQIAKKWMEIEKTFAGYACVPWAPVQACATETPVAKAVMTQHINNMRNHTMRDFYDTPREGNTAFVDAIAYGRANKIMFREWTQSCVNPADPLVLMTASPLDANYELVKAQGTGGGNNRCCLNFTSCGYYAGRFCSMTPEGACAAGSDAC